MTSLRKQDGLPSLELSLLEVTRYHYVPKASAVVLETLSAQAPFVDPAAHRFVLGPAPHQFGMN